MIVVWESNTARLGGNAPSAFAGICALSYWYDHHIHRTSGFRMSICFFMPNPTFILKAPAHSHFDMIILTDFSLIFYWFFADAFLLIWLRHTFVLIWLWPNFFLSRWLNSRIEMTTTSYWYEGKERGFFTLCYLSIWVSFFLSLIQKIWRSFASNESHLHR